MGQEEAGVLGSERDALVRLHFERKRLHPRDDRLGYVRPNDRVITSSGRKLDSIPWDLRRALSQLRQLAEADQGLDCCRDLPALREVCELPSGEVQGQETSGLRNHGLPDQRSGQPFLLCSRHLDGLLRLQGASAPLMAPV